MLAVNQTISFRQANTDDYAKIIELVETHDEDDAEAVAESFQQGNYENHFVAVLDHCVIGISGFTQQIDCDHTFYLSWTYLHEDFCGKGYGSQMMSFVLDKLRDQDARKIFIKVSDYVDPEDGPTYAAAVKLYQKFGFTEVMVIPDYYSEGESLHVYELTLQAPEQEPLHKEEKPNIKFTGMFLIGETEASYTFAWETQKWWQGSFGIQQVQIGLDAAYEEGAKQVVLSFPSTFVRVGQVLLNAGFNVIGTLKDFYEDGIDEIHYRYVG